MEILLEGDDATRKTLAHQWKNSTIASRELSGAGFSLHFNVPETVPKIEGKQDIEIEQDKDGFNIVAHIPGVEHDAGFILFIRNGRIAWLEGFTYADPWPENISEFKLERVRVSNV